VGLVKLCLLSLGILLGLYFYDYLVGLLWLWWVMKKIYLILSVIAALAVLIFFGLSFYAG